MQVVIAATVVNPFAAANAFLFSILSPIEIASYLSMSDNFSRAVLETGRAAGLVGVSDAADSAELLALGAVAAGADIVAAADGAELLAWGAVAAAADVVAAADGAKLLARDDAELAASAGGGLGSPCIFV